MGQKVLKINKSRLKVEMSQAIAAVGQISLINEYQKIFKKNNLLISQILVSPDDTEQEEELSMSEEHLKTYSN